MAPLEPSASRRALLVMLPAALLPPRASPAASTSNLPSPTAASHPKAALRLLALCEGRRPSSWTRAEIEQMRLDDLVDQLVQLKAPWPRAALTGKWKLVYLQPGPGGGGIDRRIPFPEFDFNDSFQEFDVEAGTVVNTGELLGPWLVVRVGGTLSEEDSAVTNAPKRFRAIINRGQLCARDGPCLPLPISGEGLFDGVYLDERIRIGVPSSAGVTVTAAIHLEALQGNGFPRTAHLSFAFSGQNLNGGGARVVQVRVE